MVQVRTAFKAQEGGNFKCIAFIIFLFTNMTVFAQQDGSAGMLFESNGCSVELIIRKPKTTCSISSKPSNFSLFMVNGSRLRSGFGRYLNWQMEVLSCEGELIEKTISIDLEQFNNEGLNKSTDWRLSVADVTRPFYDVRVENLPDVTKDRFLGKAKSTAPENISGANEIMSGDQTELTVVGGELRKGATWVWYAEGCGTKKIGTGSSIKVSPDISTTYFVRGESAYSKTDCISLQVIVDDNSKPAAAISGPGTRCKNDLAAILLRVEGGRLGKKAQWVWYEGGCPGGAVVAPKKLGVGNELRVTPTASTRYFVRAEGTTNTTECVFTDILTTEPAEAPRSIELSTKNVCAGDQVQLSARGGNTGQGGKWIWYSKTLSGPKALLGEGSSLVDYPQENTQYFLHGSNACGSTAEITIHLKVKEKSTAPLFVGVLASKKYNIFNLKVQGGSLGEKGRWVWYADAAGKKKLETGDGLKVKSKIPKVVYVRAEGECGNTGFISKRVVPDKKSPLFKKNRYLFLNVGGVFNAVPELSGGLVTVGSRKLYFSAKIPLTDLGVTNSDPSGYVVNNNSIENYPINSGTYYVFNGNATSERKGYTLGYMMGGEKLRFAVGVGYGSNDLLWEAEIYNSSNDKQQNIWGNNKGNSVAGPEGELRVFLKLKSFNIMAGISTIYSLETDRKFIDGNIGIGFSFNTK